MFWGVGCRLGKVKSFSAFWRLEVIGFWGGLVAHSVELREGYKRALAPSDVY